MGEDVLVLMKHHCHRMMRGLEGREMGREWEVGELHRPRW